MLRAGLALLSILALAGCATHGPRPTGIVEAPPPEPTGWRAVATAADQKRLAAFPALWARALAGVPARQRAKLKAEGPLVDPAVALELPAPPPGPYRCRLIRLGGRDGFRSFAPDFCYIEGDATRLSFTKQTGSSLPGGWLHRDSATRLVFLGALPLAGARGVPLYGRHPAQDVAGVVERVSPFRWRLALTRAGGTGSLDLYELVPVPPAVPGAQPAVPAKSR